jgi:hypothetical protein
VAMVRLGSRAVGVRTALGKVVFPPQKKPMTMTLALTMTMGLAVVGRLATRTNERPCRMHMLHASAQRRGARARAVENKA